MKTEKEIRGKIAEIYDEAYISFSMDDKKVLKNKIRLLRWVLEVENTPILTFAKIPKEIIKKGGDYCIRPQIKVEK